MTLRARDLGVRFDGRQGLYNAITDVPGVEVGHRTRISGGPDAATGGASGAGPAIRTGVTAIHPAGCEALHGVAGGRFVLNGMGEMTGAAFLDEYGVVYGPVLITNTLSVGTVRDATVAWSRARIAEATDRSSVLRGRTKPIVLETWDGVLNDVYGQHLGQEDVWRALDDARDGPVPEGAVGGGTGMISFGFKAGIGTASRLVDHPLGQFVLGVLVQANFGRREHLRISGIPVGRELTAPLPILPEPPAGDGSIVVVLATDAPLLPSQATALAKRASLGLGRVGSIAASSSGDLFLAFSTANRSSYQRAEMRTFLALPTETLDPIYQAAVEAVEEAIVNSLIAGREMKGHAGAWVPALPHQELLEVLGRYRLA